jgi:hypothetical protein
MEIKRVDLLLLVKIITSDVYRVDLPSPSLRGINKRTN